MGDIQTCSGFNLSMVLMILWIPEFVPKSHPFHKEQRWAESSDFVMDLIVRVSMLSSEHAISSNLVRPWDNKASKASGSILSA